MEGWRIENCIIYLCTTAAVLGLYLMSDSFMSLWAMLMLMFVNSHNGKHLTHKTD